jgi:hypothetical protein
MGHLFPKVRALLITPDYLRTSQFPARMNLQGLI